MRNVFFSIAYSFLTTIGLFSNLTFAANVTTGEATNVTSNSATLNGIVSNSRSPSEWFEHGTASGSYDNSTRTTSVLPFAGTKTVSIEVCGLSASKTYYYRIAAYENTPGGPSFYPDAYGEEKSFTTLPACEAKEITTSPGKLRLKIGKSSEVIVALKGDDCVPAGNTVTATISKIGSKRIWVTPTSPATDENGQAKFTITAKNKAGNAKVTFVIEDFPSIYKTMLVKVK